MKKTFKFFKAITGDDQKETVWLLAIIATSMVMLFSSILLA